MMRRKPSLRIVLILMVFLSMRLAAQTMDAPTNEVTIPSHPSPDTIPHDMVVVNLGGLTTEFVHVGYYHAISHRDAFGLLAGAIFYPFGRDNAVGYAAALAYRFHPGRRALWRFYLSPQVGYQFVRLSSEVAAGGLMTAAMIGWQWFPERRLAVGAGFGVRYIFGGADVESAALRKTFGFRPGVLFDLGYAW